VYRTGGAEVYVVAGGPYGEFDVPGVRDFVRIFAPRRGEIVVDVEALDLVPPKARPEGSTGVRPRAPRRRPGSRRGPAAGPAAPAGSEPPAEREAPADPPSDGRP
jgi:hypothetical protein